MYNKPIRCNSGSIAFINNHRYALLVSDSLCVHHQELFHGQNVTHFGHGMYSAHRPGHLYRIYSNPTHEKTPVAAVAVYSVPDDGRKGRTKHVEHTCSC